MTKTMKRTPLRVDMLLDASGSMADHVRRTVTGVNEYAATLRKPDEISVVLFDSNRFQTVRNAVKKPDFRFSANDYVVGAMTPLYDSLGRLLACRLKGDAEENRVMLVMTDGLENCSTRCTPAMVADLIERWRARGWLMIYLGADQNAVLEGAKINVAHGDAMTMDMHVVQSAMNAAAAKTARYVSTGGGSAGVAASAFSDAERASAKLPK